MRQSLDLVCRNFIKNRNVIKSVFAWDNGYLYPICAVMFAEKGFIVEEQTLKRCRVILKENVGMFSNFRGTSMLAMIGMMGVSEKPDKRLKDALAIYERFKTCFSKSEYLAVGAMILTELIEPTQYEQMATRTKKIYDQMKSNHPFLTSSEDCVFAMMLALSELTEEEIVYQTESCYTYLKKTFSNKNAVQSLSHVLALSPGTPEEKCKRTVTFYEELKSRGYKYGTSHELASLGVIAMLAEDRKQIIDEVLEVDTFLAKQKGYGSIFGVDKKQRLMHAVMLVTSQYIDHQEQQTVHSTLANTTVALTNTTIALIAAQQAAMLAAIVASSAAITATTS